MSRENRLALAHFVVAVIAFGIAAMMAVMQALSRADLQLPARTANIYYLSVTAHGVLMALVFTTFFIMGFGYLTVRSQLGRIVTERWAWIGYWIALLGTALAAGTILAGKASVLYTFYPPLQAHPAFYIGAALLIVGSWVWAWVMVASYRAWSKEHPTEPVPLAVHGTLSNVILWLMSTVGVVVEVVGLLIPWSLGWTKTVDPVLARTLFWFFGHPVVYFWLIPAYVTWYTVLPREAGGKLFSDTLGRMVFILFIVLSTPVGFHHQFLDPGIPAGWKLFHAMNTYGILFPSFVTAFTIIASLEVAGRMRGGKGVFGWIAHLPWGAPVFTAVMLAMLTFSLGGFGGAVNAAYAMNTMVHNTAWIQAHFHLTVGTAVALTFMGLTYYLLPRITGRALRFRAFAEVQPYLWFTGMMFFSIANHVTGLMGMPRRVFDPAYFGSTQAARWAPWTAVSAAGGVILFVSAMSFVLVFMGTLFWGKKLEAAPPIEWAEALDPPRKRGIWDRFGLWTIVALVLIVLAYAVPIAHLVSQPHYGAAGVKVY